MQTDRFAPPARSQGAALAAFFAGAVALLVATVASADAVWQQVPSQPVWVELPSGWKGAADPQESMLVAQGARGGTVFVLVAPSDAVAEPLGRLKRRLESEWREAKVTLSADGKLSGSGRLAETRFTIESRSRVLDTSQVSGIYKSLTLIVVTGLPKGVRFDLPGVVAGARVRWEQPGGGWLSIPGAGSLQVQLPVDAWRAVTNEGVLALKCATSRSELQLRVVINSTPDAELAQFKSGLDFAFLTWDAAPRKWTAPKGVGTGLELTAKGDHEGSRFAAVIRAVPLPVEDGPPQVLVILATTEGATDPIADATRTPPLPMAALLELSGALRRAP